jgi:glycosyltransferase involved in cell wall biosynthesis
LLLTPIAPAVDGNGLAMRAWSLGQSLDQLGELHTGLVPVAGPAVMLAGKRFRCAPPAMPEQAATSWLQYADGRQLLCETPSLPERARLAAPVVGAQWPDFHRFDLVFVFRLYMAGLVLPLLEGRGPEATRPRLVLDADEADHALLEQKARLQEAGQKEIQASITQREAELMAGYTRAVLPWFDAVTASSEEEASSLRQLNSAVEVGVLPNVYPVRAEVQDRCPRNTGAPGLLFVGNLDYWPNEDGLRWFLQSVWPLLQKERPAARLRVVGAGGAGLRQAFADTHGVDWLGRLATLDAEYARADACVLPLRAGGGTRLKALEAFSRGVPVIGTPVALAGLGIQHQAQALLADTAQAFCDAALAVCSDVRLSSRLASAARQHVDDHFSPRSLNSRMAALLGPLLAA